MHDTALRCWWKGGGPGPAGGDAQTAVIERGDYRHLYMHRTGHWLGLDVHDVGAYRLGEQPGASWSPAWCSRWSPACTSAIAWRCPKVSRIDDRWKGIGIRIEDDVAVTEIGHEVLTWPWKCSAGCPEGLAGHGA